MIINLINFSKMQKLLRARSEQVFRSLWLLVLFNINLDRSREYKFPAIFLTEWRRRGRKINTSDEV